MSTAKTPDSADLASKDSTSNTNKSGPVTRFSAIKIQRKAASIRKEVKDVSDPRIIEDVGRVAAAEDRLQPAAARVRKVLSDHDAAIQADTNAQQELAAANSGVTGVLTVTADGREFVRSCRSDDPELTARNLSTRLGASGHSVPSELVSAMQTQASAAASAREQRAASSRDRAAAVKEFVAAKTELSLAVKQLRATWIAYRMGKGIPTRSGPKKKKAEAAASESATSPPADTTPPPNGATNGVNGVHATA